MAEVKLQGTKFSFSILPLQFSMEDMYAKVEIALENEYIAYKRVEKRISAEKLEEWIFCIFRLLAGAYKREYTLSFDEAGFAVDFYAYTEEGNEVPREVRRERDCVMAIRLLMRSKEGDFLGGVHSLLLHREEMEVFAKALREEYDKVFVQRVHGIGEYLFVGVSPLGYCGCNYWYFDPYGKTKKGDCVWVKMGSHNVKQIAVVDGVRFFTKTSVPYPLDSVKRILSKASEEELREYCRQKEIKLPL